MNGRSSGFRPQRSFTAPVNVGDELDVKIEAVGEKGDGIAKEKGFVLFVPNTKEGDEVRIRITKVLRRVGFAEVIGEGTPTEKEEEEPQEEQTEEQEEEPQEEQTEEQEEEPSEKSSEETKDTEDFGEE